MTSDLPPADPAADPGAVVAPPRPEPDARAVAGAATACPGVRGLVGGSPVEVATYLPGERVLGVRVGPGWAEVHLVGEYGVSLAETAGRVREAIQRAVPDPAGPVAVDVVFEDVEKPAEAPAANNAMAPAIDPASERSST